MDTNKQRPKPLFDVPDDDNILEDASEGDFSWYEMLFIVVIAIVMGIPASIYDWFYKKITREEHVWKL